jgi:hypothetical protein
VSAIDQYRYTCVGVIECPSPYRWFNNAASSVVHIAIYLLEQDIPAAETDFQGKRGDILLGGGGGEAPALHIAIPDAFFYHTNIELWDDQPVAHAYWTMTEAYKLGAGFVKLGWNPDHQTIESWLTQHTLSFLLQKFLQNYQQYVGADTLECDGSICRSLTDDESKTWNWKNHSS